MDETGYYEGFFSLLDNDYQIRFKRYESEPELLTNLADHWPVQRLRWFTKGFYGVQALDGDVVMTDLRMGLEPDYVFRFKVGEIGNPHPIPVPAEELPSLRDWSRLEPFLRRIWGDL